MIVLFKSDDKLLQSRVVPLQLLDNNDNNNDNDNNNKHNDYYQNDQPHQSLIVPLPLLEQQAAQILCKPSLAPDNYHLFSIMKLCYNFNTAKLL